MVGVTYGIVRSFELGRDSLFIHIKSNQRLRLTIVFKLINNRTARIRIARVVVVDVTTRVDIPRIIRIVAIR